MTKKTKKLNSPDKKVFQVIRVSGLRGNLISLILLFFIPFLYFYFFGYHLFSYQENETLFIYSGEYFIQFLSRPGGLLEYAGNFITQVYFRPFYGSLLLASVFTLIAFIFLLIGKKLNSGGPFLLTLMILPACLLMLLQTDFSFRIYNHLGFLLASVYFLLSLKSKKRFQIYLLWGFFPLCYFLIGVYVWIFAGMYIVHQLLNRKIIPAFIMGLIAGTTLIISKELIFYQSLKELIRYPFPQLSTMKVPLHIIVYILVILYPVLLKSSDWIRMKPENARSLEFYFAMIFISATVFCLSKLYDPEACDLFKLEKQVYMKNWDEVIRYQEKVRSGNMVAQYYYNLALSETDQLADRMFFGRQDYGPQSLMVQWDSKANINQIFRGAYFFYCIGLINEAHRWAFESMVVQGYRPENIKMLIQTNLINGHYKMAEKYIRVLEKTILYRKWAVHYRKMLFHPELINADPELGEKIRLLPGNDFIVRMKNQQDNVLLLLQSNPNNKKAFEYMMAWFLLEKNTGKVAEEIKKMKGMGYIRLPRHIEEAAIMFKSMEGELPDTGGLTIRVETENRFLQFEQAVSRLNNDHSPAASELRKVYGNTYWYYMSGFK